MKEIEESLSDDSFASMLKELAPAAVTGHPEVIFYRAGFESANAQRAAPQLWLACLVCSVLSIMIALPVGYLGGRFRTDSSVSPMIADRSAEQSRNGEGRRGGQRAGVPQLADHDDAQASTIAIGDDWLDSHLHTGQLTAFHGLTPETLTRESLSRGHRVAETSSADATESLPTSLRGATMSVGDLDNVAFNLQVTY